jgi:GTP-binding protein
VKITRAEFVRSSLKPEDYPITNFPEIAFAGRSNVGKSSLINHLINRKSLARSSATPGKTQTLNFYLINDSIMFVDLPGYGYSKAPESANAVWRRAMDHYFAERAVLKTVFQLVDIRHPTMEIDIRVAQWLQVNQLLGGCFATKSDKLSKSKQSANCAQYRKDLLLPDSCPLIAYSTTKSMGRDEAWGHIKRILAAEPD